MAITTSESASEVSTGGGRYSRSGSGHTTSHDGTTPSHGARWTAGQAVILLTITASALAYSFHVVSFLDVKNLTVWLGAMALWAVQWLTGRPDGRGFRVLGRFWAIFVLLFFSGLAVAPVAPLVLTEGLRILGLLLFASLAYPEIRGSVATRRLVGSVVLATALCAVLALLQRAGWLPGLFPEFSHYDQPMYSVFGNQGSLGGYLAIGFVAALGMAPSCIGRSSWLRGAVLFAVAGLILVVLALSASRAGLLAALIGVSFLTGLHILRWQSTLIVAIIAVAVWCSLALFADPGILIKWSQTLGAMDDGGGLRLWVWRACLDMAAAHPLAGAGLGNFVFVAPPFLGAVAPADIGELGERITYHAHNDLLEFTVENGLFGLLLLCWAFASLRVRRPVAFSCVVALAAFSLLYPAWSSTPHALVGLMLLSVNLPPRRQLLLLRRQHLVVGAATIAGGVAFVALVLVPSFQLRYAEDLHLSDMPAMAAYERATGMAGATAEAHESFGIYLLEAGEFGRATEELAAARRGLNTGRVYLLSGMAAEGSGDSRAAREFYQAFVERQPHAGNPSHLPEPGRPRNAP